VHQLFHDVAAQNRFGNHSLAAPQQHVHVGVFLVRVNVSGQKIIGMRGIGFLDPFAGGKRRLARHVLPGGIPRGEVETQITQRSNRELVDVAQHSDPRRRCRNLLESR